MFLFVRVIKEEPKQQAIYPDAVGPLDVIEAFAEGQSMSDLNKDRCVGLG